MLLLIRDTFHNRFFEIFKADQMKYSEFYREIENFGWVWVDTKKHRRYKHPEFSQPLFVPNHPGQEIPKGTLNAIKKQAGLK